MAHESRRRIIRVHDHVEDRVTPRDLIPSFFPGKIIADFQLSEAGLGGDWRIILTLF